MENTELNKVRFFAQYWGQQVFVNPILSDTPVNNTYLFEYAEPEDIETEYLQLKPLSEITKVDFNSAQRLYLADNNSLEGMAVNDIADTCNQYLYELSQNASQVDYYATESTFSAIRQLGFLIPYNGLSVEKIIEYGWAKIKN